IIPSTETNNGYDDYLMNVPFWAFAKIKHQDLLIVEWITKDACTAPGLELIQ
ncbi:23_t:CDS:2, partial [Entrophospora sp. SA101]